MKKGLISYSEAFKMQVVQEISQGKFASMMQARNNRGVRRWRHITNDLGQHILAPLTEVRGYVVFTVN